MRIQKTQWSSRVWLFLLLGWWWWLLPARRAARFERVVCQTKAMFEVMDSGRCRLDGLVVVSNGRMIGFGPLVGQLRFRVSVDVLM